MTRESDAGCPRCDELELWGATFVPKSVERWVKKHSREQGYVHDNAHLDILKQLVQDPDLRLQMPARTRREFDLWRKRETAGELKPLPRGVLEGPLTFGQCPRHGRKFRAGMKSDL